MLFLQQIITQWIEKLFLVIFLQKLVNYYPKYPNESQVSDLIHYTMNLVV